MLKTPRKVKTFKSPDGSMYVEVIPREVIFPENPQFYQQPGFGLFGLNYKYVEEEIIKYLMGISKKGKHGINVDISVRDINPEVFGENGGLYQLLAENKKKGGKSRLIAKQDTAGVFSKPNDSIDVIVSKDVDDIFENNPVKIYVLRTKPKEGYDFFSFPVSFDGMTWWWFPDLFEESSLTYKESEFKFNLNKNEILFSMNPKNNNSFFVLYNRAKDRYRRSKDYVGNLPDGHVHKKFGDLFEIVWSSLKSKSK